MEQLTRQQAEELMLNHKVIKTNVKQTKKDLCVYFTLSNTKSFFVKYDVKNQDKSYFLEK